MLFQYLYYCSSTILTADPGDLEKFVDKSLTTQKCEQLPIVCCTDIFQVDLFLHYEFITLRGLFALETNKVL